MKIEFRKIIEKVTLREDRVIVSSRDENWEADRVILTLPIGVLKQGSITFDPKLPAEKTEAIKAIGAGLLNKVALKFPKVFWDPDPHWITRLSEEKGDFTSWLNFVPYTGAPVLVAFNAGAFARKIEKASDEEIKGKAMAALKTLYGDSIPDPIGVQITRWESDPFAHCSYSFPAVGMTEQTRKDLAAPVAERIFFAGEATSSEYPSTVHGAFLSGLREAERIGQILRPK